MEIKFNLTEEDLKPDEIELISKCLKLNSEEEFIKALNKLCKTSILEYKKMFVEKGLPTRADEVMQDRLFFLICNYYQKNLPAESEISSIFQLTDSQSRTLLRNTKSRYRTKISSQLSVSMQSVMKAATYDKDLEKWIIVIQSENILEELNLIVNQKGPTLDKLIRKRGSAGEFLCSPDTYDLINGEIGVNSDE